MEVLVTIPNLGFKVALENAITVPEQMSAVPDFKPIKSSPSASQVLCLLLLISVGVVAMIIEFKKHDNKNDKSKI